MALVIGDAQYLRGRTLTTDLPTDTDTVVWDDATEAWVYDSSGPETVVVPFTFLTSSPYLILRVADGDIVMAARISIISGFDGSTTLSIGHAGSATALMNITDNDPSSEGDYETTFYFPYSGTEDIKLYKAGSATTGSGSVILKVGRA